MGRTSLIFTITCSQELKFRYYEHSEFTSDFRSKAGEEKRDHTEVSAINADVAGKTVIIYDNMILIITSRICSLVSSTDSRQYEGRISHQHFCNTTRTTQSNFLKFPNLRALRLYVVFLL
jgi:hypothetical protein